MAIEKEEKTKKERNMDSVKKYQSKRNAIMLRPSAEEGEAIRLAAKAAGQSVQRYVLDAIRERMEQDGQKRAGDGSGFSDGVSSVE